MYHPLKEKKHDKKEKRKRSREHEHEVTIQIELAKTDQVSSGSRERQSSTEETTVKIDQIPGPSSKETRTSHHTLGTDVRGAIKKAASFLRISPVRREKSKSPGRKDKSTSKSKSKSPSVPSEIEIQERAFLLEDVESPDRLPGSPERKSRERRRSERRHPSFKAHRLQMDKLPTVCMPQSMMDGSDGSCRSLSTSRSSFSESASITREMENLPGPSASTGSEKTDEVKLARDDLATPDLLSDSSDEQSGEDTQKKHVKKIKGRKQS